MTGREYSCYVVGVVLGCLLPVMLQAQATPAVNVNTASAAELAAVPLTRLGPVLAQRIVSYRVVQPDPAKAFTTLDDLLKASISPSVLSLIKPSLTVGGVVTPPPPPPVGTVLLTCAVYTRWPVDPTGSLTLLNCTGPVGSATTAPFPSLVTARAYAQFTSIPDSSLEDFLKGLIPSTLGGLPVLITITQPKVVP